jgi:hypothetical protein
MSLVNVFDQNGSSCGTVEFLDRSCGTIGNFFFFQEDNHGQDSKMPYGDMESPTTPI